MEHSPENLSMPDLSDEALMEQIQQGSRAAYTTLVERYMQRAFALACRMVGNPDDARDLSQDVFLKIYESADKFKSGHKFFSWFYRILLNHCLNFKRRKVWTVFHDDTPGDQPTPELVAEAGPHERGDVILHQYVQRAIAALPKHQRTVIVLCDLEGMPQTEAAKILKVSEGTVRSRLHYGRQRLKGLLAPFENEVTL